MGLGIAQGIRLLCDFLSCPNTWEKCQINNSVEVKSYSLYIIIFEKHDK